MTSGRPSQARRDQDRRGAGIDRPRHAGRQGRRQHLASPVDVGPVDDLLIGRPQPKIGSQVQHRLAAGHRSPHRRRVQQIATEQLDTQGRKLAGIALLPDQGSHLVATTQ
jgi:hypothetical protein